MSQSLHDINIDPRNADILISINGELYPRDKAMVSVFDSGFILGDGVWEGLRLVDGGVPFLSEHIERLYEGAKAIFMDIGHNAGRAGEAPVRLPRCQQHAGRRPHPPDGDARRQGNALSGPARDDLAGHHRHHPRIQDAKPGEIRERHDPHTVNVRRGYPDVQDQKLNSHSKLNCITACIQAMNAGADEALMLDPHGFVATCNSTHFFIVRRGEVWTSTGQYCIPGITRGNMIRLCAENGIPVFEKPSRSMMSMAPMKPSSPALSPG